MEYPDKFPEHLQRPVDVAIAEAEFEFPKEPEAIWRYTVKIYFAFGNQVCQEVREGLCSGSIARWQMDKFLLTLLHGTYYEKNVGSFTGESHDRFHERMKKQIRDSQEWRDYQQSMATSLGHDSPLSTEDHARAYPTSMDYRPAPVPPEQPASVDADTDEPAATQPLLSEYENARQSFIVPMLAAKGWSILDWANESVVSYNTAAGYLEGRTHPYRSTRLKLANGLGIAVEELPQ